MLDRNGNLCDEYRSLAEGYSFVFSHYAAKLVFR